MKISNSFVRLLVYVAICMLGASQAAAVGRVVLNVENSTLCQGTSVTGPGILLHFTLPRQLVGSQIDRAWLQFAVDSPDTLQRTLKLACVKVNSAWNYSSLNVMNQRIVFDSSLSFVTFVDMESGASRDRICRMDITDLVSDWAASPQSNYGLFIRQMQPTSAAFSVSSGAVGMPSGVTATVEIFYTPQQ